MILLCMMFSYYGFPEKFAKTPSRTSHLKLDSKQRVRNAFENKAIFLCLKHLENLVLVLFKWRHCYKELKVAACLEPDSKYIFFRFVNLINLFLQT